MNGNANPSHPLNSTHLDKLNKVLQSCNSTECLINKLKAAGLDVQQADDENKSQASLAAGLKRNFFPHSP